MSNVAKYSRAFGVWLLVGRGQFIDLARFTVFLLASLSLGRAIGGL